MFMIDFDSKDISESILDAISGSQKEYYRWNKDSLDNAAEYFLTVNIAKELMSRIAPGIVSFEGRIGSVIKPKDGRGRAKKHFKKGGRFDLTICKENGNPWGFIEVKRDLWTKQSATNDLKRIRDSLESDNSRNLKAGFFATYVERERSKRRDEETKLKNFVRKYENEWIKEVFNNSELNYRVNKLPIKKYKIESYEESKFFYEAFQPMCVTVKK